MNIYGQKKSLIRLWCAILFVVCMFVAVGGVIVSMTTDKHGHMSFCVFMTEDSSFCPMGILDHIASWKTAFMAIRTMEYAFALASLVCFLGIGTFFAKLLYKPPLPCLLSWRRAHHARAITFFPMLQAFSDGIIHPKVFQSIV